MSLKSFIPALAWCIVILALSTGSGISLPKDWWNLFSPDKFGHAIVYGVLAVLIYRGLAESNMGITKKNALSILLSTAYGILMEILQYSFFPGRYFEVLDIIANIIGSILGVTIFYYFFIRKNLTT